MNLQDFSTGFDTLLNSYASRASFGDQAPRAEIVLDEYEKSLYLTSAQDAEILSLYSGKNAYGDSFESTEEVRRYLSNLIAEERLEPITTSSGYPLGIESHSKFFTLPENLWFITYESILLNGDVNNKCIKDGTMMEVVPVSQDEYHRIRKNPFRGANDRRALRLDLADGVVEIICNYDIKSYYVRYFRRARPIILTDLSDTNLTVNGESHIIDPYKPCELHDALHQRILERAVMMALRSKGINIENKNQ